MGIEQPLWLVPQRADRGGAGLAAAGEAIGALREGAGRRIEAASASVPWGRDGIGSAFEQNYRGYEEQLLAAWRSVGAYVANLGDSVVYAVSESVTTDEASAARTRAV
jgi:hypothetical protein